MEFAEEKLQTNRVQIESLINDKNELAKSIKKLKNEETQLKQQQSNILQDIHYLQQDYENQMIQNQKVNTFYLLNVFLIILRHLMK